MNCTQALSRFLIRNNEIPDRFKNQLLRGTNEEFLATLAEISLYPKYTDTIFEHFKELSLEIVCRWQCTVLTVAALGRIVPSAPFLRDLAVEILTRRDGEPDVLLGLLSPLDVNDHDHDEIRELLLGLFRLLNFDNEQFGPLLRPAKLQAFLQHPDRSIRFLTVRVLCLYLHASDNTSENMIARFLGTGLITAPWESIGIDYRFLALWEEKRLKELRTRLDTAAIVSENQFSEQDVARIFREQDFSPSIFCVCNILLLRGNRVKSSKMLSEAFIRSDTADRNLKDVAQSLLSTQPILITGLPGSGKTSLIRYLAQETKNSETMLSLHLNSQTDAKLLTGIYKMGTEPGTFEWHPGLLTRAVQEGRWVLIEDLDRAPVEVMSALLPLVERREMIISGRGERIRAHRGFRIIATMRTSLHASGKEVCANSRLLGDRLWRRIPIKSYHAEELREIIIAREPILSHHADMIINVYSRLLRETTHHSVSKSARSFRPINTRELFKWCHRIATTLKVSVIYDQHSKIDQASIDSIYLDALDCFLGCIEEENSRHMLSSIIAEEMHVEKKRSMHLIKDRTPQLSSSVEGENENWSIGRAKIKRARRQTATNLEGFAHAKPALFAKNRYSLGILERVAIANKHKEPILLVGETGIGKTAAVQYFAQMTSQTLVVINLSQDTEVGDLLGGYKPVHPRSLVIPLQDEFQELFEQTFSRGKNPQFSSLLAKSINKGQWKRVVLLWKEAVKMASQYVGLSDTDGNGVQEEHDRRPAKKRRRNPQFYQGLYGMWQHFASKVESLEPRLSSSSSSQAAFSFVEGNLVKAVKNGYWVLLDEINLASADTLESLAGLLDAGLGKKRTLLLSETGDVENIIAHPEFEIFAAMNPATDFGKRDLPLSIRSRFTEIYIDSPDKDTKSLNSIAEAYLHKAMLSRDPERKLVSIVTDLYQNIQQLAARGEIVDGSGQRPHFSIRSLTRALSHANTVAPLYGLRRALFEGLSMCFLTMLDQKSEAQLHEIIVCRLFTSSKAAKVELQRQPRNPTSEDAYTMVELKIEPIRKLSLPHKEEFWVPRGQISCQSPVNYIITPYIFRNLRNLIRCVFTKRHPVLIQGPTSAGKTSMVEYLAKLSGNKFIRVNNHEHTDLQEYLGTYVSGSSGSLEFQDGVLVQAVRDGHWLVLDELNLAPSDVLEALNRLLDDNRELFIPETQEIVHPHPNFILFATQNPAGPYGGRKMLSRAFRNRFTELHFDDIPVDELKVILARRSMIPDSWCGLIVEVYNRLSRFRQEQRLFEQHSFATLRDLFRWAFRKANTVQDLARNGYMLLAEKTRKPDEQRVVRETIERVLSTKGQKIHIDAQSLYDNLPCPEIESYDQVDPRTVIWTKPMRRLFTLVAEAIRNNEPVLLVGETGCGKTTVCQMLAVAMGRTLRIVNAHQNTETSDLIGSQRPIRNRTATASQLRNTLLESLAFLHEDSEYQDLNLPDLLAEFFSLDADQKKLLPPGAMDSIQSLYRKHKTLFEWHDGSLTQAMQSGDFYLLDEISLAEDSVLERINSVLDPDRKLLLAEKGTANIQVTAAQGFQFLATMNPGGDFGKKELSPALRNRFTEIWVPPISNAADILEIVNAKLRPSAQRFGRAIVTFAQWFADRYRSLKSSTISIRDILSWVEFINLQSMDDAISVFQGGALVYIDTIGANPSALVAITGDNIGAERDLCFSELESLLGMGSLRTHQSSLELELSESNATIGPFPLKRRTNSSDDVGFSFSTSTVKMNVFRLFRALQLSKPVLIEGLPGVGKTSIVSAVADITGHNLVRINLSEQTDIMDLFGSDVPKENCDVGEFVWKDGVFLQAMKKGDWVLLDEMNLASQSVLEGMNACIDHRGEVYIPELDQCFFRHSEFRLFAAQNPHHEGGGRKGLPSSFVNRFTLLFAEPLQPEDLLKICQDMSPKVESDTLKMMISFVTELEAATKFNNAFTSQGSPWEFNLRDILRWLQLIGDEQSLLQIGSVKYFIDMLFLQRFRAFQDVQIAQRIRDKIFPATSNLSDVDITINTKALQAGIGLLPRNDAGLDITIQSDLELSDRTKILESLIMCVQMSWPVILVGHSGAGKTHLLNQLGLLLGVEIDVIHINGDIDATDLIGSFEQSDPVRQVNMRLQELRACINGYLTKLLGPLGGGNADKMTNVHSMLWILNLISNWNGTEAEFKAIMKAVTELAESAIGHSLVELRSILSDLPLSLKARSEAKFQWLDGSLIRALEKGHWVVLDNANLCSPSVLDRLNSLLEPNGTLAINEHSNEDGTLRIVKPHPNFRLFLTLDPAYGEVSRAMRNRAVELFVPKISDAHNSTFARPLREDSSMFRFRNFLQASQTPERKGSLLKVLYKLGMNFALTDIPKLQSFQRQLDLGLADNVSAIAFNTVQESICNALENFPASSVEISKHYGRLLSLLHTPDHFGESQPIDSLQNQTLMIMDNAFDGQFHVENISYLLRLQVELHRMEESLSRQAKAASNSSALTSFQRSYRSIRTPNESDTLSAGIVPFLSMAKDTFRDWIKCIDVTHLQFSVINPIVWFIIKFWWNFLEITSKHHLDTLHFQAFLEFGRDLMNKPENMKTVQASLSARIGQLLTAYFKTSARETGLSMERIWNMFKPRLYSSKSECDSQQALEALADNFDLYVWRTDVSLEDISSSRYSIVKALERLRSYSESAAELLQHLSNLSEKIEQHIQADHSMRKPHYQESFELICSAHDLSGSTFDNHQMVGSLSHLLAYRSTKSLYSPCATSSLASKMERLASFDTTARDELPSLALRQSLELNILERSLQMQNVPLQSMQLLQTELKILGQITSSSMVELTQNQYHQLASLVRSIILHILLLHSDYLSDEYSRQLKNLLDSEHVQRTRLNVQVKALANVQFSPNLPDTHYFPNIVNTFFIQLLKLDELADKKTLGLLITKVFCGLIILFIPNHPSDPAQRIQVELDWYNSCSSDLKEDIEVIDFVGNFYQRKSPSFDRKQTEEALQQLGPRPQFTQMYRGDSKGFQELWQMMSNVLRTTRNFKDFEHDSNTSDITKRFHADISALVQRLSHSSVEFQDLTLPVRMFLHGLRIGLGITLATNEEHPNATLARSIVSATPYIGTQLLSWDIHYDQQAISGSNRTESQIHTLRCLGVLSRLRKPSEWSDPLREQFLHCSNKLFEAWEKELEIDANQAQVASSLYRFKGGQRESDAEIDQEFEALFPVFESEIATEEVDRNASRPSKIKDLTPEIAELHFQIFFGDTDSNAALNELLCKTGEMISQIMEADKIYKSATFEHKLLPITLLKIDNMHNSYNLDQEKNEGCDVYARTTISEAREMTSRVRAVLKHFKWVSLAWPEQETPHIVIRLCQDILQRKHTEPIMRALSHIEALHNSIGEWQSITSKEYSAHEIFEQVTDLIVRWRQMELAAWAKLLDKEVSNREKDAKKWWFLAYKNFIAQIEQSSTVFNHDTFELAKTAEEFIATSSLGEFSIKLKIMSSIRHHAGLAGTENEYKRQVGQILENVVDHFERFRNVISTAIFEYRSGVEKEIQNVIKLASWKDRNIIALKQSAKSSHRRLFRLVKKFRDFLAIPIHETIQRYEKASQLQKMSYPKDLVQRYTNECSELAAETVKHEPLWWDARPPKYRAISKTLEKMKSLTASVDGEHSVVDRLNIFMESLEDQTQELRASTPSTLTDKNASLVKHLTTRKRKLFANTMKEIKMMGISSNLSSNDLEAQCSSSRILSTLTNSTDAYSKTTLTVRSLLHQLLDLMPRIRITRAQHSDDLSRTDVERACGYFEGFFQLIIRKDQTLFQFSKYSHQLRSHIDEIQNLWNTEGCGVTHERQPVTTQIRFTRSLSYWLPTLITTAINGLEIQAKFSQIDNPRVLTELKTWRTTFENSKNDYSDPPQVPAYIISIEDLRLTQRMTNDIGRFRESLIDCIRDSPETKWILGDLVEWTAPPNQPHKDSTGAEEPKSDYSVNEILESHFNMLDLILGSIQDVNKSFKSIQSPNEEHNWLLHSDKISLSRLNAFHVTKILASAESIPSMLSRMDDKSPSALNVTCASLRMSLPIIEQYYESLRQELRKYEDLCENIGKLVVKLANSFITLSEQGYCQPEGGALANEHEQSEKLETGTGLGEGKGVEDISKDVMDDEDLSEVANGQNEKESREDLTKNDDAVSIEGDLEAGGSAEGDMNGGELEKSDDGNEDESVDDNDEDFAMDEDMHDNEDSGAKEKSEGLGEISDSDPSKVDEKMWNEASDDKTKVQDGEIQSGQRVNEELAAANDESTNDARDDKDSQGSNESGQQSSEIAEEDRSELDSHLPETDESGQIDPHVEETEALELPEDLRLDAGKDKKDDDSRDDSTDDQEFDEDTGKIDEEDEDQMQIAESEDLSKEADNEMHDFEGHEPAIQETMHTDQQGDGELTMDDIGSGERALDRTGDVNENGVKENNVNEEQNVPENADATHEISNEQLQDLAANGRSTQQSKMPESKSTSGKKGENLNQDDSLDPPTSPIQENEVIKKLGDILDEWHKRYRPILEPNLQDEPTKRTQNDLTMNETEFEHIKDDTEADTQAIGPSSEEQSRAMNYNSDTLLAEQDRDAPVPPSPPIASENMPSNFTGDEETEDKDLMDLEEITINGKKDTETFIGQRPGTVEDFDMQSSKSNEEMEDIIEDVEDHLSAMQLHPAENLLLMPEGAASKLWQKHESRTHNLSVALTEQLRLVLAPTLATRLRGDFRTGKRLNIKRIIPYIASQYKRDKIWMRRSVPSKRAYQILLSIDDSKSMRENRSWELAFETLALLARSLTMLEVGEIAVAAFGEDVKITHDFGNPFTSEAGAETIGQFGFQQGCTNVKKLILESTNVFRAARAKNASTGQDLWQLQLIISDGICEDHESIRQLLVQAQEERIMIIFVIVDTICDGQSIVDLERVEFIQTESVEGAIGEPQMRIEKKRYLEHFPFKYYMVVQNINELPNVLATALRQWFAEVADKTG